MVRCELFEACAAKISCQHWEESYINTYSLHFQVRKTIFTYTLFISAASLDGASTYYAEAHTGDCDAIYCWCRKSLSYFWYIYKHLHQPVQHATLYNRACGLPLYFLFQVQIPKVKLLLKVNWKKEESGWERTACSDGSCSIGWCHLRFPSLYGFGHI